ncbi:hypothetical protein GCM10027267_27630 [Paramicrobacterium agarici]
MTVKATSAATDPATIAFMRHPRESGDAEGNEGRLERARGAHVRCMMAWQRFLREASK